VVSGQVHFYYLERYPRAGVFHFINRKTRSARAAKMYSRHRRTTVPRARGRAYMISLDAPPRMVEKSDAPEFAVAVYDSFEDASVGREEWDKFVQDVGGDIYVSYDWCRIWWRHYGQGRQLRLFIFREGRHLVGLAPMFIERLRLGPVSIKIAKRVGADFAGTIFSLPFASDFVEVAYSELITQLIGNENCDAVWFGFMPGNDPTIKGLREACRSLQGLVTIARDTQVGPHTQFRLPDSFEAYLTKLDSRQRQNYRRRFKLLQKSFKVESDVIRDPLQAHAAFVDFKTMHTHQWQAEGTLGHFGDWPQSEPFNADLVNELSRLGRFRMVRLFADEKVISSQYVFVFGDCCYWRLPARAPESNWDRFGLGVLGMVELIKEMINEGVRRIEAGVAHYDYKIHFGGEELRYHSLLVMVNRTNAALRTRIFLKLSDLLHLVYYRAWRLRVARHFPLRVGTLWQKWICCRL